MVSVLGARVRRPDPNARELCENYHANNACPHAGKLAVRTSCIRNSPTPKNYRNHVAGIAPTLCDYPRMSRRALGYRIAVCVVSTLLNGCGSTPLRLADVATESHATLTSVEANGGARSDVYVAIVTFLPGDQHTVESSAERDQYLVVREGSLLLHAPSAGEGVSLGSGDVLHLPPGASATTVAADTDRECKAILATVVCGEATFPCEFPRHARERGLTVDDTHGALPHVHRRDAQNLLHVARGTMDVEIVVEGEGGAPRSTSFDYLDGNPDVQVPEHTHDTSMEILFVESGSGSMHLAGREIAVGAGSLFVVPRGTSHDFHAVGPDRFRAVQLYAPSGPEQRFRLPPP